MEFRYLSHDELEVIKTDEKVILQQLKPEQDFLVDQYGDIILDASGDPVYDTVVHQPMPIHVPESNIFYPLDAMDRVPIDAINGYDDVYSLDNGFIKPIYGYHTRFLAAFNDGLYQGGLWLFSRHGSTDYIGIYGIRTSIANYLMKRKGTARALLNYIETLGYKVAVIPWPLESMHNLISQLGYQEHTKIRETPETIFLAPVTKTSNYWTKNISS